MQEPAQPLVNPAKLCQIEIQVSDLDRSLRFYREVFGWEAVPADMQEYVVLAVPPDCPFGLSLVPQGNSTKTGTGQVVLYFKLASTAEAERCVERARQEGGGVRFGPKNLPGYGSIYQVCDPDGHRFGLFVPLSGLSSDGLTG